MIAFRLLLPLGASLAVLGQALAQSATPPVGIEPSATSATYGDWTTRCARDGADAKALVCEAVQTLVAQGQSAPLAQVAIGRPVSRAPLRLTIVVPVNVAFDKEARLQVEEQPNTAATLGWRRCAPGGCFADVDLKPETLAAWRAATKPGQILFKNAANQDVLLPFSLRGLGQAVDALPRS